LLCPSSYCSSSLSKFVLGFPDFASLFFPICLLVITRSECIPWIVEGLFSCLET
jgi:hypothetical protein